MFDRSRFQDPKHDTGLRVNGCLHGKTFISRTMIVDLILNTELFDSRPPGLSIGKLGSPHQL